MTSNPAGICSTFGLFFFVWAYGRTLVWLATGLASLKDPNIDETKALLPSGFGEMTALMYRVNIGTPGSSIVLVSQPPKKIVQMLMFIIKRFFIKQRRVFSSQKKNFWSALQSVCSLFL